MTEAVILRRLGRAVYGGTMTSLGTEGAMPVIHGDAPRSLNKYRSPRSRVRREQTND